MKIAAPYQQHETQCRTCINFFKPPIYWNKRDVYLYRYVKNKSSFHSERWPRLEPGPCTSLDKHIIYMHDKERNLKKRKIMLFLVQFQWDKNLLHSIINQFNVSVGIYYQYQIFDATSVLTLDGSWAHFAHVWRKTVFFDNKLHIWHWCRCKQMPITDEIT